MKILTAFVMTMLSVAAATAQSNTITVNPKNGQAKTIRLQVVADNIIRVEETPEGTIPQKKTSLVVVPQKAKVKYSQREDDTFLYVDAPRIHAKVNKTNGLVTMTDANGKLLLSEDGKSFQRYVSPQTELPEGYHPTSPEEVPDRHYTMEERSGYSWNVSFTSPDDEAIYGLGQHQSEEMNYKGKNEELFQYNTKVSIPFVVSTAGYGILWDSYSYGRWGNPENYRQLGQVFRLSSKDFAGGLVGTYIDAQGKKIVRQEDSLYFENSREIVNLPEGFKLDGARVTYDGYLTAPESNEYKFILYYAGYMKVYIDGHLVVPERWRTAWNPNAYKFDVALLKGRKTPIRIEWKPDGAVSYCGLRVASPMTPEQQKKVSIWAEMDKDMDYYVIAGDNMDEIIKGYRQLTGKAQVMPKWSLGFWQSRERYKTQEEVETNMAEFRKRGIPCDVIVQDWNYWVEDQWGSFAFDPERFPNPQGMYDKVHSLGGRLMISCWPKYYCNTDNYKELDKNGWMYHQAVKDNIKDWVGPGYVGSFYDAYSAGARKMFWRHMDENLYSKYGKGMDAWWMDASEPNVRDCTPIDYRKLLCGPTALGPSDQYFNSYSVVNADAIYNGQRESWEKAASFLSKKAAGEAPRVFLLTRSGFAGEQRYSTATWSGDIGTRWEDMRAQITAGLNFSMAGVPFWGMDIGGFCVENRYVKAQQAFDKTGIVNDDLKEWRELQARWNELGCFMPLYRTHGQWPLREVWNIAPDSTETYQAIVNTDKLRYRLMPYIYSMAGWVHFKDYTMLRGLAMDFPQDTKVHDIKDQWMFGPALMACPVMKYGDREREVYLPNSLPLGEGWGEAWYDLFTGESYPGGQTIIAKAPYDRCPVYVRAGSIIPFGPELQYSDEKQPELINLYVYEGKDGDFQLYEDEGNNYNYEKGKYATIDIHYDDATKTLTIGARKGTFKGMLTNRRFNVVFITRTTPQPLNLHNPQGTMVNYTGKAVQVKG